MVRVGSTLLWGVAATVVGLLIAGGTYTLAADRTNSRQPTLVPTTASGPATLQVPDVTGQAYVFAKGMLQDQGFAWHVAGTVRGFAANTVSTQQPTPGTTVLDTGAPTVTLTLTQNPAYSENGTPENDAPYPGTSIKLPANVATKPVTSGSARVEPVPLPQGVGPQPSLTAPATSSTPSTPSVLTTPRQSVTPVEPTLPAPTTTTPAVTTSVPTPGNTPLTRTPAPSASNPVSSMPRSPDFTVPGAPKEPAGSQPLPDRVAALASWIEIHRDPSAANLNHWLYEHAYVVAGARFGWWHGTQALKALIDVDRRAEALWGVGSQSRTTAQKALSEVLARTG